MIQRLRFTALAGMLLAAACAPAQVPTPVEAVSTATPAAIGTTAAPPALTLEPPALTTAPGPLPQATSRGPNLEATDPLSVSLASGGLQLVEFFRFT